MDPFTLTPQGLRVAVRVTPKSARDRILGVELAADGRAHLKVTVTVPPEDGKANQAVVKVLAKSWKLPKTALSVESGATARSKILLIAGGDQALLDQLRRLIA